MKARLNVRGIEGLTLGQLTDELKRGGRFVVFEYVVSAVVLTFRRHSSIIFVRPGEGTARRGRRYSLATLLLGWWALPLGPTRAARALRHNAAGGTDVTHGVVQILSLAARPTDPPCPGRRAPFPWEAARGVAREAATSAA